MKTYLYIILSIILFGIYININTIGNETLPGSFTVTEDDPTPVISNLGLHRSTGQIIQPNSGTIIPNTRHSIRFRVTNDFFELDSFQVRVGLFKSDSGSLEAFQSLKTNASGDALIINFSHNQGITIEYEASMDSDDHSFDDQFFNVGRDQYQVPSGSNFFDFEIYFNMSKVLSYQASYMVGVAFTQEISGRSYTSYAFNGSYYPNAYVEVMMLPTTLSWQLEENQTFEAFDYQSSASLEVIPSLHIFYISNADFDLEMSSSDTWLGRDLDYPDDPDAIVEAYLSTNPIFQQTFGLKVNITGVPNKGVDLTDFNQSIAVLEQSLEYGRYASNLYIWLGILANNFQNGSYNGTVYINFTL